MNSRLGFAEVDTIAVCLNCGKELVAPKRGWKLYCSSICCNIHRKTDEYKSRKLRIRICPNCQHEFSGRYGKYCSPLCASRYSSAHSAFVSRRIRKAAGLCSNCGLCPPLENRSLCVKCKERKHYKKLYNLTQQDYDNLLIAQQNVCKICHRPPDKLALDVDHDHFTGIVRGLLCRNCNTRLGWYQKYTQDVLNYLEAASRKENQ